MQDNDIKTYSIHNEGKSVVAKIFLGTLQNKLYKYMTSVSRNVFIDKLDKIVNKYNNTYYSTVRMRPGDVNPTSYIDFNEENDKDNPKFEVGDHERISKHKNIFAKGCFKLVWKRFVIKKVKNTLSWTYFISEFNDEEIVRTFSKKVLQKTNQREFRVEKVIEKADKLYVKLKDQNNYFHSWIDTKEIV